MAPSYPLVSPICTKAVVLSVPSPCCVPLKRTMAMASSLTCSNYNFVFSTTLHSSFPSSPAIAASSPASIELRLRQRSTRSPATIFLLRQLLLLDLDWPHQDKPMKLTRPREAKNG